MSHQSLSGTVSMPPSVARVASSRNGYYNNSSSRSNSSEVIVRGRAYSSSSNNNYKQHPVQRSQSHSVAMGVRSFGTRQHQQPHHQQQQQARHVSLAHSTSLLLRASDAHTNECSTVLTSHCSPRHAIIRPVPHRPSAAILATAAAGGWESESSFDASHRRVPTDPLAASSSVSTQFAHLNVEDFRFRQQQSTSNSGFGFSPREVIVPGQGQSQGYGLSPTYVNGAVTSHDCHPSVQSPLRETSSASINVINHNHVTSFADSGLNSNTLHQDSSSGSSTFSSDKSGSSVMYHAPLSSTSSGYGSGDSGNGSSNRRYPSSSSSDMEALLLAKDAELQQLRDAMARNEEALVRVAREKEQRHSVELRDAHTAWQQRLQAQQAQFQHADQALRAAAAQSRAERDVLRRELDSTSAQLAKKDDAVRSLAEQANIGRVNAGRAEAECTILACRLSEAELTVEKLRLTAEDTERQLTAAVQEAAMLRRRVEETEERCRARYERQAEVLQKELESTESNGKRIEGELRACQLELMETQEKLERLQDDRRRLNDEFEAYKRTAAAASMPNSQSQGYKASEPCCQHVCSRVGVRPASSASQQEVLEESAARKELERCREDFTREREQWLAEKNKVILYQKQLQLNYVQILQRNKRLEAEVEQLAVELDKRHSVFDLAPSENGKPPAGTIVLQESAC